MTGQNESNNRDNGFWWGLIIGAVAAGLAVYLLDKDKDRKENLIANLKEEFADILAKFKKIVQEEKVEKEEVGNGETVKKILLANTNGLTKTNEDDLGRSGSLKTKKFFRKNGKKLH
ncbi:MAG: hypothetical protein BWY24_00077 [Microgenomates group bacterium ADurb.Bin219]|mgnify:CR=1 FL=1|nr:MAG: hypothetical protein BWY24_00077 [Microgenomates group bacterium ADurb.Bin219]HNP89076.1 hypothetical protein [Candidatus Woesebacteria bacterium]